MLYCVDKFRESDFLEVDSFFEWESGADDVEHFDLFDCVVNDSDDFLFIGLCF